MKAHLTKSFVEKADAGSKPYELYWDDRTEGFGLRVTAAGAKSFLALYTLPSGQQRRFVIGKFPAMSVENARTRALEAQDAARKGMDQYGDRQAARTAATVAQLADEYLEHVKAHRKPLTLTSYRDIFRVHILPVLGGAKVEHVSRKQIMDLHSTIGKTRGRYVANRTLASLSAFFNYAASVEVCKDNPCRGVKKYREEARERLLSPDEMARLMDAMDFLESQGGWVWGLAALRLLMFTGCRRNEILFLKWEYVDFDNKRLNLPDSKTGKKTVHLNAAAIALLERLEEIGNGEYVIQGRSGGCVHSDSLQTIWRRVITQAGLPGLRVHDLRHCFASVGVASGLGLSIVGKTLGHANTRTTDRYAHHAETAVGAAVELIGERMLEMIAAGRKVQSLPGKTTDTARIQAVGNE